MSTLSVGAMNQLGDAFEKEGYDAGLITKLRSNPSLLKHVKSILNGDATLDHGKLSYVVDGNAELANIIPGWAIEENQGCGRFDWSRRKVGLYCSEKQKGDGIKASHLRNELSHASVLNASVLDYLLAHPELIPEEWKGKNICFWGTILRDPHNKLIVRHLFFWKERGTWEFCNGGLDIRHDEKYPAAIFTDVTH